MIRVLLVGGGHSARRFAESFWQRDSVAVSLASFGILGKTAQLAEAFALPYQRFDMLSADDILHFDCVIMCVPIDVKYALTRHVLEAGYQGALILEKPLALCRSGVEDYIQLLSGRDRFLVGYCRDFLQPPYMWRNAENMEIVWPSIFADTDTSIVHDLPHLLNWMLSWGLDEIHLSLADERTLQGTASGRRVRIAFSDRRPVRALINGQPLPTPDYRRLNLAMLDAVMHYSAGQAAASLINSQKIAEIISEIRSTEYGYQNTELQLQW